ncbi:conserved protein of unknown function [Ruminococcaceae bacterium BL-6]|nr:conserved protein of unknown function [Ruminococcaceae bacterium BL-6]
MIPDQTISIKINNYNRKRYIKLGYLEAETSDYINLDIKDLSKCSKKRVKVICDYCGCEYYPQYYAINRSREKSLIHKDSCKNCEWIKQKETFKLKYGVENAGQLVDGQVKRKQTNLKKYGVEIPLQNDDIKEKSKQTCLERYGVENPLQAEDIKLKVRNTNFKKYGVEYTVQSEDVKSKIRETNLIKYGVVSFMRLDKFKDILKRTCLDRYGVKNVSQSEIIKDKKKQTCLKHFGTPYYIGTNEFKNRVKQTLLNHYGVDNPMKSKDIKEKATKTLYLNGNVPTSSQQLLIFNMIKDLDYNAILNYPELSFNLDIAVFIDNYKIDIEYDGWYWHQNISKDIARNKVLIKHGWNVIRILSGELIPEKEQIQQAINDVLSKNKSVQLITLSDWIINKKKDEVI